MNTADGCVGRLVITTGGAFAPIPFGEERRGGGGWAEGHLRCHDCGARPGHFHHPGCDVEECPRCRGQLISCDCQPDDETA
jgi:hypothetical protein